MTQEEFKHEAKRLRDGLVRQARRYLDDKDEAEDTAQDALLRLWQMVGELHKPMDGLALVLTRNLAIDKVRSRRPLVRIEQMGDVGEEPDDDRRTERMMRVLETLPPMQQAIVRMRHMDGLGMAEIASLTGTTEAAVRKSLSRARQNILNRMKEQRQRNR